MNHNWFELRIHGASHTRVWSCYNCHWELPLSTDDPKPFPDLICRRNLPLNGVLDDFEDLTCDDISVLRVMES